MWQAKIFNKESVEGRLVIQIEYLNTTTLETFTEEHQTSIARSADWLGKEVAKRISQLEGLVTYRDSLTEGEDIIPVEPTATEIAKSNKLQEYSADLTELEKEQKLVDLGVLTEAESNLVALRASVKKTLLEYRAM